MTNDTPGEPSQLVGSHAILQLCNPTGPIPCISLTGATKFSLTRHLKSLSMRAAFPDESSSRPNDARN
jgi:hypothetical protein